MKIIVAIRNVFGNELIYPVCEKAKLFSQLCGGKTFSPTNIRAIKALGYTVEVKSEVPVAL